jgi:hypothetical protein
MRNTCLKSADIVAWFMIRMSQAAEAIGRAA